METNTILNIDALTPSRQALLTDALAGHSVELTRGMFSETSQKSLDKIGLSAIEIMALEAANRPVGGNQSFVISGGAPRDTNNPFSKDKWDSEAQRKIIDTNPTLARKLMKEAGVLK